ncbi:MAG: GatB/YqeY domain-containing protein [Bacteroidia bacterium]|nr:GatB/YqeY domain-containing protein [Bacteroidia bacterium]
MSLQQQINTDIITAMKAKDEAALRTLRALKAALMIAATAEGAKDTIEDDAAIKIFQKLAKQRKESMDIFISNGRDELAKTEQEELTVIEKYLPKQMSEDEIKGILQDLITQAGASGPGDFAKVMPLAMKSLAGKADGKIISALLKQLLG